MDEQSIHEFHMEKLPLDISKLLLSLMLMSSLYLMSFTTETLTGLFLWICCGCYGLLSLFGLLWRLWCMGRS
ncbi:hypothetical protein JYB88_15635 [Shewanella cyperi]|uniref:Uncharacterized protein n=1 Tax=Shewanella cyperi TaxID=2814292 RepID=A0A974XJT6_9GAMM|nr:hypothetical protein [Shewanella cyperi]QSX29609.1 hypothetical protein JYB88_15635 [Shewanella cyperi]